MENPTMTTCPNPSTFNLATTPRAVMARLQADALIESVRVLAQHNAHLRDTYERIEVTLRQLRDELVAISPVATRQGKGGAA
jgi:hypothetical protein